MRSELELLRAEPRSAIARARGIRAPQNSVMSSRREWERALNIYLLFLLTSYRFRSLIRLMPGRINKCRFLWFYIFRSVFTSVAPFFVQYFAKNNTRIYRFNQFNCCFSRRSPTPVATVLNHGPSFCILRVSVGLCHSRSWFFVVRSGSLFRSVGHRACGPRRLIPEISFNLKPPRL